MGDEAPSGASSSGFADPFDVRLHCVNCYCPLGAVYSKCASCKPEPPVELCLTCFSLGAEPRYHKCVDDYKVVHSFGSAIFVPKGSVVLSSRSGELPWGKGEEIALLEGVDRYNLGNWEDVVKWGERASGVSVSGSSNGAVGDPGPSTAPSRTGQAAKEHYDRYYVRGTIGQYTIGVGDGRRRSDTAESVQDHSEPLSPVFGLLTNGIPNGLRNGLGQKSSYIPALPSPNRNAHISPPVPEATLKQNAEDLKLLAYMPRRDDYEKEWCNNAELAVSQLNICPELEDEDAVDRELMLAVVDRYLRMVKTRRKRKALVRDYNIVPQFLKKEKPVLNQSGVRMSTKKSISMRILDREENNLKEALKRVSKFQRSAELERILENIRAQKLLQERISSLQTCAQNGVKSLNGRRKGFDINHLLSLSKKRTRKRGGAGRKKFTVYKSRGYSKFLRWRKFMTAEQQQQQAQTGEGSPGTTTSTGNKTEDSCSEEKST